MDVEQALAALNENELRTVLSELIHALHDENIDKCYEVLRNWDLERLLLVKYKCPDCGHEWEEQYESACDSECPSCDAQNIEALSWTEADTR